MKEATVLFAEGYNCAEAILLAAEKSMGLPPGSAAAAAAFGGGMARTGSTCGALTGALMALGLAAGPRDLTDKQGGALLLARARALMDAFRTEFGALDCSRLTGYDLPAQMEAFTADRRRREHCRKLVAFAARWLEEQAC